jgi:hypothetical protein
MADTHDIAQLTAQIKFLMLEVEKLKAEKKSETTDGSTLNENFNITVNSADTAKYDISVLNFAPALKSKLGKPGYFLGYPSDTTGYQILMESRCVAKTSDVMFFDNTVLDQDSNFCRIGISLRRDGAVFCFAASPWRLFPSFASSSLRRLRLDVTLDQLPNYENSSQIYPNNLVTQEYTILTASLSCIKQNCCVK